MDNHPSIIVTGGAGYIGAHAVYALIDAGFNPIVIDNLSTGVESNIANQAVFYHEDIANTAAVKDIITKHNVTGVMHFAGSIIVPESVSDPEKYYRNNTINSLNLISLCLSLDVKAFVFSSTAAVYGEPEVVPITEASHLNPINPYGASKLMTEMMLQDMVSAHGGMNYGILRYFNVAGADPDLRCGQSGKNSTHLIKIASETAIGKRDKMSIFGTDYSTPDGTCIRDYIHVSDLADIHVKTMEHLLSNKENLIANCGYGHGYSVKDVINAVNKNAPSPITAIEDKRRAGDPEKLISSNEKIKSVLGWSPQYDDLNTIVKTAMDWERKISSA